MNNKAKILDIAMNLNRVGNWAADDYLGKKERIKTFLVNTSSYIQDLNSSTLPAAFAGTFSSFTNQYPLLQKEGLHGPKDPSVWAESMMTWGNILTHRAKLLT
jgi:hypothetical protein